MAHLRSSRRRPGRTGVRARAVGALLCVASVLPACGFGEGDDGVAFTAEGELRLALVGIGSLDPAEASPASVSEMILADLLYGTLTELDADGRPGPGLASYASSDRQTWRFTVHGDATFGDGRPVRPEDVIFTLERIRAQKDTLAALQLEGIESMEVEGDDVVAIRLTAPSAVFPEILAAPVFGIVESTSAPAPAGNPMTSGQFSAEVTANGEITLRRTGTGSNSVVVELHETESDAYDALVAGDVDWAPVPVGRLDEAVAVFGSDGLVPFVGTVMLGVNDKVFPLGDDRLRQALVLALDRAGLADAVVGPTGRALTGLVPDGVPGAARACLELCGPDPERVAELVDSVFPTGQVLPLRLVTDQSDLQAAVAEVLVEQWASVGLEVRASALEPTILDQVVATGQHQLFLFPTLGLGRSASAHLAPLFASDSPDNLLGYRREGVDERIAQAMAEPSPTRRARLWSQIERLVLADAVAVPLIQLRTVAAQSDRIRGFTVRVDGSVDLSELEFASR